MKKNEGKLENDINSAKEQLKEEISKRSKIESEMQNAKHLNEVYEGSIKRYQSQINDLHDEIQRYLKRWEGDKTKMQAELDKCYKEIKELNKKNESLALEKQQVQAKFDEKTEKAGREKIIKEFEMLQNDCKAKVTESEIEKFELKKKIALLEENIESLQLADTQKIKLHDENEELKNANFNIKSENHLLKGEVAVLKSELDARIL